MSCTFVMDEVLCVEGAVCGVTTNKSESFNPVVKAIQAWNEVTPHSMT